uniref:Uncharacterized protein n=1 Tax=Globodera rostochiensis TaxID=31243 RepID=A0A914HKE2_GLORO
MIKQQQQSRAVAYEAEDGRLPDGKNVRYAIDANEFRNFSWRGFVVFSTIQEEIVLDVNIHKSSVYKLLVHYRNPTEVNVELEAKLVPVHTQTSDSEQFAKAVLAPSGADPLNAFIETTPDQTFVLNPGRWNLHVRSPKRLYLDYVVLIPSEYYQGQALTERIIEPCRANETENCVELLYPPIPTAAKVQAIAELDKFEEVEPGTDNVQAILSHSPSELLPTKIGHGAHVRTDDRSKEFRVTVSVPENGIYYLLVDYHSWERTAMPVRVRVQQNDITAEGILLVNHCPYAFFCREMLSAGGRAAMLGLQKSPPATTVTLQVQPGREFSIGAVTLVKEEQWHNDLLGQKALCVRKNGVCVAQRFPQPPNSIRTEAEKSGKNVNSSIAGDKLPFQVAGEPSQLRVMALDGVQSTLDIEGVVASPDNYVFVVHYFSPDNPPILVDVLVQNERFGDALFHYCPSMSGCRAIVLDRHSGQRQFRLEDKYVLTFYANNTHQKGPIYIDYVVAVPQESYSDRVLRPLPLELADEFVEKCSHNNFRNLPRNATDYCRQKIFSLTTEFNGAAQACDCNTQGSLDFACADYGGQCKCKPNVIGRKCDRCAAGYFNFPDCIKCKCGLNHQCDEKNGQCYCPRYVDGIACDRCVQYAYGYDALIGCQLCGCSINGSMGAEQRCDPLNGQCLCKENVGGRKCEHCLSGYYSFPECRECDCEQSGTTDDVCNDRSSKCLCKKNVVGPRCDQCRPGTFDLRKSDLYGCSECFCFRVTDRCHSSNWPIQMLRIPDEAWSLNIGNKSSTNGTIVVEDGRIVYAPESGLASDVLPMDVTFEARLQPGMDYTRMYGLHLSYAISSFPSSDRPKTFSQPDVRLYSTLSGEELEHWANEQPRNASQQFNVVVTLFPEYWLMSSGEPANRQQLMNILLRLDRIQVKASYYERPAKAVLEQFQMEMADSGAPARDEMGVLRPTASSVELCECPEAYTGPSCQECAQGYYRLPAQHGTHLTGACIPCQCHGHSGTCDPQTGICLNCQHNTDGEYCERCSEGFYGNATTGSAAACLRCPCPHPIESNNFATACAVSERGILQHCACREGYAGERCELCAPGFFGDPLVPNGECKRCDCNNNNDLSNPGACNPRTGDCALCEGNTDGRHCEYCKAWYWGDAVEAKNCTLCACNQCGSIDCNGQSAHCKCQPRVSGSLCDRCEDNAWGFDSCKGCTPCQCGFAASNSQCDLKTGQCACMPGAAGQLCDQCAHGFWNYGAHGCQKCDCEADLSMGTVCDVRTGQCHCQEGATGPRCDKCLPGYLRVPNFGCRFCDECVYALAQGTDAMNERLADLRNLLSNVSSEALTGARLNRVQKQMVELEPMLERVVAANDPEAVELDTEITPTIGKLKENASASALRAERMVDLVGQLDKRLNDAYVKLGTVRAGGQQLVEQNRLAVEKIGNLKRRFETQAPLEISREELQAEAEQKMERIRKVDANLANAVGQAQAKMQLLDSTIGRIQSVKNQREELRQSIDKNKTRLDDLNILKMAFQEQIATIKQTVTDVKKVTGAFSLFQLNALIDGIGKDRATANQNVTELQAQRVQINDLLAEIAAKREVLNTHIARLGELRAQLTAGSEVALMMRKKRQTEGGSAGQEKRGLVISKVAQLEAQGQKIAGIYDATRLEAHRAIEAASVYGEIAQALLKARNGTSTADQLVRKARTQLRGVTETAKSVKNSTNPLLNTIDSHVAIEVAATRAHADTLDGRLAALQPRVAQIKSDLAKASEAATELSEREGSLTEIDKIRDEADVAYQKIAPLNASFEEWKSNLVNVDARVDKLMTSSGSMNAEADTAKDQIQQVDKAIPMLSEEWEQVKQRLANTAERVDECRTKLGTLKERVATARDKANRIRLGAHFEQQRKAFLELPMPPADDLAVHNDIRFFFRTRESNGQLLFLGANNAQLSGEYIAVELDNERPKLTVSLGARSIGSTQLQTPVNDMQWRELAIKRMGRAVTFGISKPGMDERAEEKNFTVDGPPKSVLNLFDDARHLFVGGSPRDFQLPAALQHNQFTGDLDKLRINGELVGFWNSERSQGVTGAEVRKLADAEKSAESGVSFNGKGYMQKEVGGWNPRKRMAIMFSFMTFSPDGLLFFMGKDRDQLVLELVGGRISLSFDLGSGLVKLLSNGEQYNDGNWHLVQMDRQERSAKLKIDDTDKVEGESPGSMFEMSVSDVFYIGGLPSNIDARFTVHAFHGCMRNLKLDDGYVELAHARATKGVQLGCVNKEVRIGTLLSERAYAQFTGLKLPTNQLQLSFRFRPAAYATDRTVHLLTVFANNDQEEIVRLVIENGTTLVIKPNGAETDANDGAVIRAELGQHLLAGNWHHVSVQRDVQTLSVQVDDSHAEERATLIEDASDLLVIFQFTFFFLIFNLN